MATLPISKCPVCFQFTSDGRPLAAASRHPCGTGQTYLLCSRTTDRNRTRTGVSEGFFRSRVRRKMVELMPEGYPRVLGLFPGRHCWLRQGRISECAQSYADNSRPYIGMPKQCRPTIGAEMEPHLAPFRGVTNILPAWPVASDLPFPENHCDSKWRARAALTLTTVTGDDAHRLAAGISSQ